MGYSNVAVNAFIKRPTIAADLFNGAVFGGKSVVQAKDLEPTDGISEFLDSDVEEKIIGVERFRDVTMKWKNGPLLMVLACENQSYVNYAMPVRTMIYDGLSYQEQIKILWDQRKDEKVDGAEFMSQLRKDDKLTPVLTLVFYYDNKKWDGSKDLYGLLDLGEDEETTKIMEKYIPNYRINIVDPATVEENVFQTELRLVIGAIKRKGNKKKMEKYFEDNEYFKNMDEDTYDALGVMLDAEEQFRKMKKKDERGKMNMCKALQDMCDDNYSEGRASGLADGAMAKLKEMVVSMVQEGFSLEVIAKISKESLEVITDLVKEIQEGK